MRFVNDSTLNHLDLSFNRIGFIDNEAFANLKILVFFNLEGNQLKSIGNGLLKNLKWLQKINLNQNEIYSYDDTSFLGLKLLNNIYMSLKRLKLNDFCNIKSSISTKPFQRNILGIQYYYATNLIDRAHEIDCEMTLFFIKSNIQLNLFTDKDLDEFVIKCFRFDFKSEKK